MATSNYYQLYLDNCFKLAETMVIKSQHAAEGLNRWVRDYYGVTANELDPRTWKYYLNISGQYHFTDEQMKVVSLDTLEEIIFSRENLVLHRATARGYAYGTREYRQLVARYPSQELLILGILYPVDIDTAIAAPDGKILTWPTEYVEPNEYSLIANLQKWIDGYKLRWTNAQYSISDDLYPATALGVMYLNLVPAILNLRLQACKSPEAHSFHVRQYLASHGMLDVYMDALTLKQTLFLYRNIAYIERNSGQRNIFEWLVEHIMTERHLPIAEYVMRHNLSEQPTQLYPTVEFHKNPLNPPQTSAVEDTLGLQRLLQKEDTLARDNPAEREEKQELIQAQMENSPSNVVLTKALESAMWDYSNATPYTLEDTLVNHWLWLSSNGYYYQAVVAVNNPKTGERIPMMVKDAFVFMWYAFCGSIGIRLEFIPQLFAKRVQRLPTPTVDEVLRVVDAAVVPREVAAQALSLQPVIRPMISTEAFYNKCLEINAACQMQRNLTAAQEHQLRRGMVQGLISQIYSDNICQLAPANSSYDAWFADRNIRIADFTQEDLALAWLSLTKDATGMSLHTTLSLANLQKAMLRLLGQLSSYSVQFLHEINEVDIRVGDAAAVRVGDRLAHVAAFWRDPDTIGIGAVQLHGQHHERYSYDLGLAAGSSMQVKEQQAERLEIAARAHSFQPEALVFHYRLEAAPVYIRPDAETPPNSENVVPVMGLNTIFDLTDTERAALRDVWREFPNWPPKSSMDLSQVLNNVYLPGFDYSSPLIGDFLKVTNLNGFNGLDPIGPGTPPPTNLAPPSISGTTQPGDLLTATTGAWSGPDLVYSYQWQANGVAIQAATAATYVIPPTADQVGKSITVVVTATNSTGVVSATSAALVVAPMPVADVGNYSAPTGQRITGWHHPSNAAQAPYLLYDTTQQQFLLKPGPALEVPLVHFDNITQAGVFHVTVSCTGDSQVDANYFQVVKNGTQVLGVVGQGQTKTFDVPLALYDYLEFQLVGPSATGANFLSASVSDGSTTWSAVTDFLGNLGEQSQRWKYFYRDRTGDPNGVTNSAGPMQPNYAAL